MNMALSVWAVAARVPSEGSPKEHLALEVVVGAPVYLGLLHLFRVAAYRDVLKVLSSPAWTPIRVRTSERAAADRPRMLGLGITGRSRSTGTHAGRRPPDAWLPVARRASTSR